MKLSNEEIQELIIEYQSKVRKAEFQLVEYKQTLASLEKSLLKPRSKRALGTKSASTSVTNTTVESATPKKRATSSRRRKPAAKKATSKTSATSTRRRGRPAKKTTAAASTATPAKKTASSSSATKSTGKAKSTRKTAASKRTAKKTARKPAAKKTTAAKSSTTATKRRGRPAKKASTGATKKAAPKKTKSATKSTPQKGGYRLNEWDELVIATLNDRQKVSVFSDFHEKATAKAKSEGRSVDEKTLYSRINQSLHKLANKRDVLVKVPHEGRGYAYGLKEWKSPSGKGVQKKYQ